MKTWINDSDIREEAKRLANSLSLKKCVLCGAINAVENKECFLCSWHGEFDSRTSEIEKSVHEYLDGRRDVAISIRDEIQVQRRGRIRRPSLFRGFKRLHSPK